MTKKPLSPEEKKLIEAEIDRRIRLETGTSFTPYTNRDGSESWQQQLDKVLCDPNSNEVWAVLANGSGKVEPMSAMIHTPTGLRRNGDLKVGDLVCTPDGGSAEILKLFPQMHPMYRLTFSDGESIVAGKDHLWEVNSWVKDKNAQQWLGGNRYDGFDQVITTENLAKRLTINNGKSYNHNIPLCKINYNSRHTTIDPYLLGVFLGDGDFHQNPHLTTPDDYIYDYVGNGNKKTRKPGNKAYTFCFGYKKELTELGLKGKRSWEKFIPEDYKYNTEEVRLSTLQGLLDTDGCAAGGAIEYSTTSEALANDVAFLARSLGGLVKIKSRMGKYKDKTGVLKTTRMNYRVAIQLPASVRPFRLERKLSKYNPKMGEFNSKATRSITNIEYIGEEYGQCLMIDHPRHLYVTGGDSAIVTHNSSFGAYLICRCLYGTYPAKDKVFGGRPLHIHFICEDTDVQRLTIQKYIEGQTDYNITGYAPPKDKSILARRNAGIIKELINLETQDKVTFSTAAEGSTGLVGVQPDIMYSDEPISKDVYDELVARNRGEKAKFVMACTAIDGKHGWIIQRAKELQKQKRGTNGVYLLSSKSIDNPYFPLEKLEYWKHTYGEDSMQYRVRALGELVLLEGLVFDGINGAVVPNDYVPEPFKNACDLGAQPFRWYESADFGFSATDPTLIIYAKQYDNGDIVVEDEICIYQGTTGDWCDAIIEKRYELGMRYRNAINVLDPVTELPVCKPDRSVGDGKYLQRRNRTSGSSLKSELADRKIYMRESNNEKIEERLPSVQSALKDGTLKIKEKCVNTIEFLQMHTYKTKADGTQSPENKLWDHSGDTLRYLFQVVRSIGKLAYRKSTQVAEKVKTNKRKGNRI